MTTVRVLIQAPADGPRKPAAGELYWRPTARRVVPAGDGQPAAVVLPKEFTVSLVAGAVDVDVEPSGDTWAWTVTESFDGLPSRRRHLAVPDQTSVDYADLIEIDPATFDPAPSPNPAWLGPLNDVRAGTVTPDPDHPGFYLIGA